MASRYSFSEQSFVGFFEVGSKFCMHFFLLGGIKGKAGEAMADKFLPIRHGTPSSVNSCVPRS